MIERSDRSAIPTLMLIEALRAMRRPDEREIIGPQARESARTDLRVPSDPSLVNALVHAGLAIRVQNRSIRPDPRFGRARPAIVRLTSLALSQLRERAPSEVASWVDSTFQRPGGDHVASAEVKIAPAPPAPSPRWATSSGKKPSLEELGTLVERLRIEEAAILAAELAEHALRRDGIVQRLESASDEAERQYLIGSIADLDRTAIRLPGVARSRAFDIVWELPAFPAKRWLPWIDRRVMTDAQRYVTECAKRASK